MADEQPEGPDLEAAHILHTTGGASVSVVHPWEVHDCECKKRLGSASSGCDMCDGHGWVYWNSDNGEIVSEMMRDAMERHG